MLRPTAQIGACDAIVIESTYGNRLHEDVSTRETKLREAIMSTIKRKGVLIIPAFAVERTQDLLYELNQMWERGTLPKVDVYLDSPMAIRVTEVMRTYPQYYDMEALERVMIGDDLLDFPGLHRTAITPVRPPPISSTANLCPLPFPCSRRLRSLFSTTPRHSTRIPSTPPNASTKSIRMVESGTRSGLDQSGKPRRRPRRATAREAASVGAFLQP